MSEKRTWDETMSPQWRYLLRGKKSKERKARKELEELFSEEGGGKRVSKRQKRDRREKENNEKRNRENENNEERKNLTKSGKPIVFSASPHGPGPSRYHNKDLPESRKIKP